MTPCSLPSRPGQPRCWPDQRSPDVRGHHIQGHEMTNDDTPNFNAIRRLDEKLIETVPNQNDRVDMLINAIHCRRSYHRGPDHWGCQPPRLQQQACCRAAQERRDADARISAMGARCNRALLCPGAAASHRLISTAAPTWPHRCVGVGGSIFLRRASSDSLPKDCLCSVNVLFLGHGRVVQHHPPHRGPDPVDPGMGSRRHHRSDLTYSQ